MTLGERTRQILQRHGIDGESMTDIERGEVSWDLVSDDAAEGGATLMLFHAKGGSRDVVSLTREQVDELVNASDFERRERDGSSHSSAFSSGSYDDWAGVSPDSNWDGLVDAYRQASRVLAQLPPSMAEPWLFLCRHTIELQLKAIIMLGQQAMDLCPDLPAHHDLQRLWTAAFPFVCLETEHDEADATRVKDLVREYHRVDPASYSFRYPVSSGNSPVRHPAFLFAFSREQHVCLFQQACDHLGKVIQSLRLRLALRELFRVRT